MSLRDRLPHPARASQIAEAVAKAKSSNRPLTECMGEAKRIYSARDAQYSLEDMAVGLERMYERPYRRRTGDDTKGKLKAALKAIRDASGVVKALADVDEDY